MCSKDVCSEGSVIQIQRIMQHLVQSSYQRGQGRRTREDTYWAMMAYADKGAGWNYSLYELITYCEHDAITEVLKMKADSTDSCYFAWPEKKKKIIYTESFVFIHITKSAIYNMLSLEKHVTRKPSWFHLI